MNRRTIDRNRRRARRGYDSLIKHAVSDTLLTHARMIARAKDRIDLHDEKLGIGRPIDSWRIDRDGS